MSVTDAGYSAPRAADVLAEMRDDYESRLAALGITPDVDWDRDVVLGLLTAMMADRVGAIAEFSQSLADSFSRANAQGIFLDNIGLLTGTPRLQASYSTVTLTVAGVDGTVLPADVRVRGGGSDGKAEWRLTDDTALDGQALFQAIEPGPMQASPGTITTILTPIEGWSTVTNDSAASLGRDVEPDGDYLVRQQESLQSEYGTTVGGLRAALLELDFVSAAIVVDNPSGTATTTGGLALDPYAMAVVLYPSTLTAAQRQTVAETFAQRKAQGTPLMGTDVVVVVDGVTVAWDYATLLALTVGVVVEIDDGFELADVEADIEGRVEALVQGLTVGQELQDIDVLKVIASVAGLKRATVTLNGGTGVTPSLAQLLNLTSVGVTE